ncbi:Methicillin resistance mecR1 protein [Gimesia alba]|uniref:Methicillin resistance mecR1 protein n=1 Tax=Gimesia alba TaxID=2527973 RepID=A0A517RIQ3_9PLAN|nr:M56 family metallopeptidase [Gimesia alba]QDT43749.1 Methicillin resistance mecR1 protein [Gimesia alba]
MSFFAFSPQVGLLTLNIALASISLGLVAVLVGRLSSRCALPTRHGLFCVALVLMLVSPLLIWGASHQGLGIVPILMGALDREDSRGLDGSLPADQGDDALTMPIRTPKLLTTPVEEPAVVQSSTEAEQNGRKNEIVADSEAGDLPVAASPGVEPSDKKRTRTGMVQSIGVMLALVWAVVAVWFLIKLVRGLLVVQRLRRSLRPATDPRITNAMLQVNPDMGQSKMAPVYESEIVPAPLTLGLWRSVIVIPEGLAESLNESELACVLAHEVAHVTRHDTLIAILQQLAGIGFWWNPLLRMINRQISQLRERICDDYVVQRLGEGLPLAEAIVKVAEWSVTRGVPVPLTTTLLDEAGDMEQRITRLMKPDRRLSVKLNLKSAAFIGLVGIMLAAIPLVPAVRAQVVSPNTVTPEKVTDKTVAAESANEEWRVQIRVIDADGNPIPNPEIGVQPGGEEKRVWQTGDQEGKLTVSLPTRTPRYCYLLARASGYAPMRAFWGRNQDYAEDPLPAEFTFQMTKAITVGGTVVDEDNQPIANASVLFSASSEDTNPVYRAKNGFYEKTYLTDQQGQWRCDLAPATISDASMKVSHPDYVSPANSYDQTKQIPELRQLKHSWTLKKGFEITGRVVDTEGTPVQGAVLALGELNLSSRKGPIARTDAEGMYRFEKVSPLFELRNNSDRIRFTITIMKHGFMPVFESVPGFGGRPLNDSTEQKRIVNFTLKPGVKLKLHVVDSQDQPIEGAWVMLKSWHATTAISVLQEYAIPTETDAQGNWQWENAPPGEPIYYDIVKPGFADIRDLKITVEGTETEKTITLKQPQLITGKVFDAKTRQPIEKFIVERAFENVGVLPGHLSWANDPTRGKNGTYKKRVTMPPHNGSYTYRARAEGYETAVSKSTPFKEGETVVNFELQPKPKAKQPVPVKSTAVPDAKEILEQSNRKMEKAKSAVKIPQKNTIAGRIVDQNQLGIGGAEVILIAYSDINNMQELRGRVIASAIADSEGYYEIKLPAEGGETRNFGAVWAKAKGYVAARSNWSTVIAALRRRKQSTLSLAATTGTWVDVKDSAGAPVSGVRVIPRNIGVPRGIGYPMPKKWEDQSTGVTGADGRAHLPHVAPQAIKGMVLIPPGNTGSMHYNQNFFLNVRPTETAPHFTLQLPEMGSVKGQLVVAEGSTLPKNLQFSLQSVTRRPIGFKNIVNVPIGADGTFSVAKLAVGSIFVPAFLPENQRLRADVPARIDVKANQETQLKIRVDPGVKVYGRIQKSDTKEKVKNYEMKLIYGQTVSNRAGNFEWLNFDLVTDSEGRFECYVPPGPINLRISRYADGYTAVNSWLPRKQRGVLGRRYDIPDQESFDLGTIDLVKNIPITGQVVDLKNQSLIGWSVYGFPKIPGFTQSETMNSMAGVRTDKKGTFKGSYPETYPPAYWKVSHRVWKTKYRFQDLRYVAKVISHKPFILQVDTSKEWQYGEPIPYDPTPLSASISSSGE